MLVTLNKMGKADLIKWGDPKSKECKSEAKLYEATALLHGAKSSAFFKMQVHMHLYTHTYTYAPMRLCTHAHMRIYTHAHMHTCTHA